MGNDDSTTNEESNDPYAAGTVGKISMYDVAANNGPGPGKTTGGYVDWFFTNKFWWQDFARLQLGPAGSAKWFVISDPKSWRAEYHMRKVPITERMWNVNADGRDGITDRVILENDQNINSDFNLDGQITNTAVAFWDDDPNFGSFGRDDNVDLPTP